MNLPIVIRQLGLLLLLLGGALLLHALVAMGYWAAGDDMEEASVWAFLTAGGIAAAVGGLALAWFRGVSREIGRREACLLVVLAWLSGAVVSAIPFVCWSMYCSLPQSGMLDGVVDPFFEAMSGLTTCGATILTDIEALPRSVLLWRSTIQWIGGLGVIVIFVAILPSLGTGGKRMYLTETTGPTPEGLRPHARETARVILLVYVGFTLLAFPLLMIAGMPVFDAICHTFTTVATGGFSTRNASIAAFDSPAIEAVMMVFMVLSGISFSLYFLAFRRRFETIRRSSELRLFLGLLVVVTLACSLALWAHGQMNDAYRIGVVGGGEVEPTLLNSFRYGVFTVVSILTTSGFATAVYEDWPGVAIVSLISIFLVGAMAGSTSGGIKLIRVWIAGKLMLREIEREFRPDVVRPLKVGRSIISPDVRAAAIVLVLMTLILAALGTGLLKIFEGADGIDLTTASSAAASCLANVGPAFGRVGSDDHYSWLTPASKTVLIALMLLGRLELFVVLSLLTPRFWGRR
ncbi:MAG: TrkH family potassium uptake protein [Planctomycetota bacterium]|nr:TrkH family potassium uptake protein [Planctomycetota bacterium]MEE2896282.1 TrkH family potassium uptake protein [Planctomycetota bacterium]